MYNHPSVVYYTVFNEGWGQFDAAEQYRILKAQGKLDEIQGDEYAEYRVLDMMKQKMKELAK